MNFSISTSTHDAYHPRAGHLCLDFANTKSMRTSDRPYDWLESYTDLAAWSQLVGLLSEDEMRLLQEAAEARPAEAEGVFLRAVELREAVYHLYSAYAHRRVPEAADLECLNAELSAALCRLKIRAAGGRYALDWDHTLDALDWMLWPVARSAAELLTSAEARRVGECQGEGCGALFVDMSKNHSRRWCDMRDCGNRAKARQHYARRRKAKV